MKKKLFLLFGSALLLSSLFITGKKCAQANITYDYNVTDAAFGANGSDKDWDSVAIQGALDKAASSDKVITVYIPAGDYYLNRWLRIYSNTHLILDANATLHRGKDILNKNILQNVDKDGNTGIVGGYNMSQNITIEGGIWDGGDINAATEAADLIRIDHAENITIKNCIIKNVYDCHLVELIGVKNGSITGCTFSGFRYRKGKQNNWTFAREAVQLETAWTNNPSDMDDASSYWAGGTKIDGTACENITISDNQIIDMPCGIGQHHFDKAGKYRNNNITISNNTFAYSGKSKACKTAITCAGMNNVTIENNTVSGPYRFALHIEQADTVSVKSNSISGITMNGIMVDSGNGISVDGNTIQNIKKHGVSIGGGKVTSISDNSITKAKHDGISIDSGKVTLVSGNTILNSGKHAISVTGGVVGTGKNKSTGFINNTIKNCKQNGISISAGTVSAINGNTISKVGNNGISLIKKAKIYWVVNNKMSKCKSHGLWNGSTGAKTKTSKNKGA